MPRILVIEDEHGIRENLLSLLRIEGFDVRGASNGQEGLATASSFRPDLVLCDVMMPMMDGHAVLAALRSDPVTFSMPFIFLTARADRNDLRKGMTLGADDYLTKPFSRQEVFDAVHSRIERAENLVKSLKRNDWPEIERAFAERRAGAPLAVFCIKIDRLTELAGQTH